MQDSSLSLSSHGVFSYFIEFLEIWAYLFSLVVYWSLESKKE